MLKSSRALVVAETNNQTSRTSSETYYRFCYRANFQKEAHGAFDRISLHIVI